MEPFELLLLRKKYTLKSTLGELFILPEEKERFSWILEDVVRGTNIKIPGHTAIPAGRYKVKITMSHRFKREMPIIYNQDNGYELIADGKSFKGIRLHGGNTHLDTEGCPLTAEHYVNDDKIYGSKEKELTAKLKELGGEGFITIINT